MSPISPLDHAIYQYVIYLHAIRHPHLDRELAYLRLIRKFFQGTEFNVRTSFAYARSIPIPDVMKIDFFSPEFAFQMKRANSAYVFHYWALANGLLPKDGDWKCPPARVRRVKTKH